MMGDGVDGFCAVHANIKIQAHTSDVHSGVCGGSVGEPLLDMTRLLSTLVHLDGRIAIPGFYESVRPLEDDELGFYREVIDRTAL